MQINQQSLRGHSSVATYSSSKCLLSASCLQGIMLNSGVTKRNGARWSLKARSWRWSRVQTDPWGTPSLEFCFLFLHSGSGCRFSTTLQPLCLPRKPLLLNKKKLVVWFSQRMATSSLYLLGQWPVTNRKLTLVQPHYRLLVGRDAFIFRVLTVACLRVTSFIFLASCMTWYF